MPEECFSPRDPDLAWENLIIVSNRGPVTFQAGDDGEMSYERSGGGLVTALLGLARQANVTWIAAAASEADRRFHQGEITLDGGESLKLRFIEPQPEAYNGYYNVIANPLLWFLQHSMWDFAHSPTLTHETWQAWEEGYTVVNRLFADEILRAIRETQGRSLVMLQDYHLYLVPRLLRRRLRSRGSFLLSHFIHIPWPGSEDWSVLPPAMRTAILDGLCGADLLGFQTKADALSFIRTCETLLPGAHVNYRHRRVWVHQHATQVRDFPISIDVEAIRDQAAAEETQQFGETIEELAGGLSLIVRIDRTEPSKNIVRGFQAFDELLDLHPEHQGKVRFIAILVPSRLEVGEYQTYLDELMAAAGRVNVHHGTSEWEPVRVLVGESYPRALAALQRYDVLLVNPVADGMNLVCKEGPVINQKDGVIVLSERAGAHQQLGENALVISPCDVFDTAQALHAALTMPPDERRRRADRLRRSIEQEDIRTWLCWQVDELRRIESMSRG